MINDSDLTKLPTVQIFGLGYIGLPTAAVMSDAGFNVIGVDILPSVVETINRGNIHIEEIGLEDLVRKSVKSGKLRASLVPVAADVHIVAVPTPIYENKSANIDYVRDAITSICKILKHGDTIVVESTIPPLTCLDVIRPLVERLAGLRDGKDYNLAHCPERVIPGRILHEILYNDRIIGGTSDSAISKVVEIYSKFVKGKLLTTNATTAEVCKLMENTFRDVNIALANQFAAISENLDIDVMDAIVLANHHPRVNIHMPSIGVGGHCIPVDPWFLIESSPGTSELLKMARKINDDQPALIAKKILEATEDRDEIILLGLSYKPDVDDLRESPAIDVARIICDHFASVNIVEPHISTLPIGLLPMNAALVPISHLLEANSFVARLVNHSIFHNLNIDFVYPSKL